MPAPPKTARRKTARPGEDMDTPVIECPHCWELVDDPGSLPYNQITCPECGENVEGGIHYKSRKEAYGTDEEEDKSKFTDPRSPSWGDDEHHNELNRQKAWGGVPPEMLAENPINNFNVLGGGINDTYTGDLEGDGRVILKSKAQERSPEREDDDDLDDNGNFHPTRWSISPGYDAEREKAAHIISKHLDLPGARVPTTDIRHVEYPESVFNEDADYDVPTSWQSGPTSVQHMIPNAEAYDEGYRLDPDELRNAALFDSIIGNHDRHGANGLITDAGFVPIDHGLSFPDNSIHEPSGNYDLHEYNRDFLDGAELQRHERDHLQRLLNHPTMWNELNDLDLPPNTIPFTRNRIQAMIGNNKMLDNADMTVAHGGDPNEQPECVHCGTWRVPMGGKLECANGCDEWEDDPDADTWSGNGAEQREQAQQALRQQYPQQPLDSNMFAPGQPEWPEHPQWQTVG